MVLFNTPGGGGDSSRHAGTVLDVERIDPDPRSIGMGTALVGDLDRQLVRTEAKPSDREERLLIASGIGIGIDHLQPAVDVDVCQAGPRIRTADPGDAGASECNRRHGTARVRQGRIAATMERTGIRVPVAAIGDTRVVLLNSGNGAALGEGRRSNKRDQERQKWKGSTDSVPHHDSFGGGGKPAAFRSIDCLATPKPSMARQLSSR